MVEPRGAGTAVVDGGDVLVEVETGTSMTSAAGSPCAMMRAPSQTTMVCCVPVVSIARRSDASYKNVVVRPPFDAESSRFEKSSYPKVTGSPSSPVMLPCASACMVLAPMDCNKPTASFCCQMEVAVGGATVDRQFPLVSTSR